MTYIGIMAAFVSKMGIIFGGLKAVLHVGASALDWLCRAFENILYFDFGKLFTGNNNRSSIVNYDGSSDKFSFFASPSSPFFIIQMILISLAVLLLGLFIVYSFVKRAALTGGNDSGANHARGILVKVVSTIFTIFFIPFIVFSSTSLASSLSRSVFKSSGSAINSSQITGFRQGFSLKSDQVYSGKNNFRDIIAEQNDNSPWALYSHEVVDISWGTANGEPVDVRGDLKTDLISGKLKPFNDISTILDRVNYELAFLRTNNSYLPDNSRLLISTLGDNLNKLRSEISNNNYFENIKKIRDYARQVRLNASDQAKSIEIDKITKEISGFNTLAKETFNGLRSLAKLSSDIIVALPQVSSKTPDLEKKINSFFNANVEDTKKIKVLNMDFGNKNISDPAIKSKIAYNTEQIDKGIALANIFTLTNKYIAPERAFDWGKEWNWNFEGGAFDNGKTLMSLIQNSYVLNNVGYSEGGATLSAKYLAAAYSSYPPTPLSKMVNTSGWGNSLVENIIFTVVGYSIMLIVFGIMYQLIKRLLHRILKIVFLWLIGVVVVPTTIATEKVTFQTWLGVLITEIVMVFVMAMGWTLWSVATPILMNIDFIPKSTSFSGFASVDVVVGDLGGQNIAVNLLKIFIVLASLEAIIKMGDWFSELIGGDTRLGMVNARVQNRTGTAKRTLDQGHKSIGKGIKASKQKKADIADLSGKGSK